MSAGSARAPALTAADARALQECVASGGVAVFPADTVYGLACDPGSPEAIAKLYDLKGRPEQKPSAVLFGSLRAAAPVLDGLGPRTAAAAAALLPGPVTLLLGNPHALYPLAGDPAGSRGDAPAGDAPGEDALGGDAPLGVRVPAWPRRLAVLAAVSIPLLQSSANLSGEPPALALDELPASIRRDADLVLDGGRLPGIASTVIDLRRYERDGTWELARVGALRAKAIAEVLGDPRG